MRIYMSRPGVICAGGNSVEELWQSAVCGNQKGIKKVLASNGKSFFVGKVDDSQLKPSSAKYDMRIMRVAQHALAQIEKHVAAATEKYGASRVGVCVGSCDNGTELSLAAHREFFEKGKFPENYDLEIQGADYVATFVRELYNLGNVAVTFSTACSSSAGALIKAAELIRCGVADAVVAGGVDIVSDTVLLGFDSLEAVSGKISNPFSRNRSGITLGEGAAFFVLTKDPEIFDGLDVCTSAGHAGGSKNVFLAGYGESADAYHITAPDPSGQGAEKAMLKALELARVQPCGIGYVNLHGTGTRHNDAMEAQALARVFGEKSVFASSTKPITGHTLGAASAVEAAVCWAVLSYGANPCQLPLHVFDGEQDESLPRVLLVREASVWPSSQIQYCMSNSFAFGGANASLIFGI